MIRLKTPPVWLIITTFATLAYLVVELAFNARLLDIVGINAQSQDLNDIQKWGRCISGFAVALAFWPMLIQALANRAGTIVAGILLAVITGLIVGVVYIGEERLVEELAHRSTAAQKARAAELTLLQKGVKEGDVQLAGLEVESFDEPATKAFFALFPALTLHIDDLEQRIADQKEIVARRIVAKAYGGLEAAHEAYVNSLREIRQTYNGYAAITNAYYDALDHIPIESDRAWKEYQAFSRKSGYGNGSDVPFYARKSVRREVQRNGIPVSDDWRPGDKKGFLRAAEESFERKAATAFDEAIRSKLPGLAGIKPGLAIEQFSASHQVQTMWLDSLEYPPGMTLKISRNNPSLDEFERGVFAKVLDIRVAEQMAILEANESEFESGADRYDQGVDQVTAIIAPALALTFSFVGAIFHIFKFGGFAAQLISGGTISGTRKFAAVVTAAAVTIVIFSLIISTSVTRSELYGDLHEGLATGIGRRTAAFLLRGAINAQPTLYSASRTLSPLIGDPSFGGAKT